MALTNILVLQYNNYFNRTIKHPTNPEYMNSYYNLTSYRETVSGVNFYKGDGVNAELTINTDKEGIDYLVEYDNTLLSPLVISRWFIIENKQTRSGQRQLTLRRDVIIDNLNSIVDAPIYVEKATIQNPNDVAIYNQEEISFNEIKKDEFLLHDSTKIPWIVGFFTQPKDSQGNDEDLNISLSIPSNTEDYTTSNITNWLNSHWGGSNWFNLIADYEIKVYVAMVSSDNSIVKNAILKTKNDYIDYSTGITAINYNAHWNSSKLFIKKIKEEMNNELLPKWKAIKDDVEDYWFDNHTNYKLSYSEISQYNNRIVKDTSNNKYYKITIEKLPLTVINLDETVGSSLSNTINGLFNLTKYTYNNNNISNIIAYIHYTPMRLVATEVSGAEYTINGTINKLSKKLYDAPYKMLVIPVGKTTFIKDYGTASPTIYNVYNDFDQSLRFASEIATKLSSFGYDFQLVPYFPMQKNISYDDLSNPFINLDGLQIDVDYSTFKDSNNLVRQLILYCDKSTFTFDINKSIQLSSSVEELKIINQCEKYRLCSSNYSAIFDFNLAKTGNVTKFNVDCTYKPYNPYIHINPDWSKLYGKDYNDIRGLICQGDFSIPILNDAWINYQINNKNYLNAFNRQIESVELNNKYARISEALNVGTGAVSGAISGAVMGGVTGAIVGGAASAAGGIADMAINEKLRRDSLDLTKDQFNYSLQNIKALPNSLSKVSSIDANNKIFPVLEYYSCTEEEKEIFKNKMKYNGMSIMRIDNMNSFLNDTEQYFKGKVIRLDDLSEDYHMANSIADELYKGVFIKL